MPPTCPGNLRNVNVGPVSKIFTKIALTGNYGDSRVLETLRAVAAHLLERGLTVFAGTEQKMNGLPGAVTRVANAQLADDADLIIAVGGDGSMLHAARIAVGAGKPLLGINRGRLGFLADVSPSEDFGPLDGRLLEFKSYVDERYVNTHGGDGFIVATPTGSTAYALSCGGPIVAPGLDALVLAPICPHTLSDRPIVIPGTSITDIQLGDDDTDSAAVSCDGEVTGQIEAGDRLRVAVAEQCIELIHPTGYDYFGILRSKLHWGRGNRNRTAD